MEALPMVMDVWPTDSNESNCNRLMRLPEPALLDVIHEVVLGK